MFENCVKCINCTVFIKKFTLCKSKIYFEANLLNLSWISSNANNFSNYERQVCYSHDNIETKKTSFRSSKIELKNALFEFLVENRPWFDKKKRINLVKKKFRTALSNCTNWMSAAFLFMIALTRHNLKVSIESSARAVVANQGTEVSSASIFKSWRRPFCISSRRLPLRGWPNFSASPPISPTLLLLLPLVPLQTKSSIP